MKKILNFRKWIGLFAAIAACCLIGIALYTDGWFKVMLFIAPQLSYGFTMMYSWRKSPRYTIVMTILLLGMSMTLSFAAVVGQLVFANIATYLGMIILGGNLLYAVEFISEHPEDNFFEINFQNQI